MVDLNLIKHNYLVWVSKTSAFLSFLLCFCVLSACFYFEHGRNHSLLLQVLILTSGWLIWGFTEYLVHRFLFHFHSHNTYLSFIRYLLHGVHHHEPGKTLFIPLIARLITQVVVFSILKLVFGEFVFLFYAGLVMGVSQYISIHYMVHHKKLSRYLPRITKYHYIHHYIEPNKVFGISNLFWDRVFGTFPSKKYAEIEFTESKHFIQP